MTIHTISKLYSHRLLANIGDAEASKALYDFTAELNVVESIMADSTIRIASLTSLGSGLVMKKAYRWLPGSPGIPAILERLSKYPFLHADKLIAERRFEEMGYVQQRTVCCIFI